MLRGENLKSSVLNVKLEFEKKAEHLNVGFLLAD